jgi:DNA-binding NtrC family response regulator
MVMPHNGGHSFEKLKKINPDLKIILISGYTKDYAISDLAKHGYVSFLQKPFDAKALSQKIMDTLNN